MQNSLPTPLTGSPSISSNSRDALERLKNFLASAPLNWKPGDIVKRYPLGNGEQISCVCWKNMYYITGTDIVKILLFRFQAINRPVINTKKFEEGVFSDLRNLKPGQDAVLEEPRSDFLDALYRHGCIRTQKKQKVFFWFSVPHDRLFMDALERDLKRESNIVNVNHFLNRNALYTSWGNASVSNSPYMVQGNPSTPTMVGMSPYGHPQMVVNYSPSSSIHSSPAIMPIMTPISIGSPHPSPLSLPTMVPMSGYSSSLPNNPSSLNIMHGPGGSGSPSTWHCSSDTSYMDYIDPNQMVFGSASQEVNNSSLSMSNSETHKKTSNHDDSNSKMYQNTNLLESYGEFVQLEANQYYSENNSNADPSQDERTLANKSGNLFNEAAIIASIEKKEPRMPIDPMEAKDFMSSGGSIPSGLENQLEGNSRPMRSSHTSSLQSNSNSNILELIEGDSTFSQ